ncbi:DUF3261 domain-containing protein [Roseateles sp. P5_D6]
MRPLILFAALLLSACQTLPPPAALPPLQLAPAAFGAELSLAQRLTVTDAPEAPSDANGAVTERQLDTLLQVDAKQLQLVGLAFGQRVLTMQWDGRELNVKRHPMLPAAVDPARVLRDVALVFAPLPALQAALPAGWTLDESRNERTLRQAGETRLTVRYLDGRARVEIDNRAEHYQLRIESRSLEGG